eukprot:Nk52_evm1s2423 gene=Nk52_evmTU1s2423
MSVVQRFLGRNVVVTGAGSGIGRALTHRLLREGATVAMLDVNPKGLEETMMQVTNTSDATNPHPAAAGRRINKNMISYVGNICDQEYVNRAIDGFAEMVEPRGGIHHLVNCAGIAENEEMVRVNLDDWDRMLNIHLRGSFMTTQRVSRNMIKHIEKDATASTIPGEHNNNNNSSSSIPPPPPPPNTHNRSIVNLSSIIGKTGNRGQASYATAKAGIQGFTKTCAQELGYKHGIRVNCVLPGFIHTPMTMDHVPPNLAAKFLKVVPLQRFGQPEDVAAVVDFSPFKRCIVHDRSVCGSDWGIKH